MIKYLLSLFLVVLTFSCSPMTNSDRYSLERTDEVLSFPVIEEVRAPQITVFLFKEKGLEFNL